MRFGAKMLFMSATGHGGGKAQKPDAPKIEPVDNGEVTELMSLEKRDLPPLPPDQAQQEAAARASGELLTLPEAKAAKGEARKPKIKIDLGGKSLVFDCWKPGMSQGTAINEAWAMFCDATGNYPNPRASGRKVTLIPHDKKTKPTVVEAGRAAPADEDEE